MATSFTDIANLALSEIGAKLIASLETESSEEARVCRLRFPQARDALLRQHGWNFAVVRADLSKVAEAPVSDWDAAWQMPGDCVRVLRVAAGDPDVRGGDFSIEGRRLLTRGADAVSLVYVSNAVAVGLWDALFVEALSYLLASKVAGPLTQSPSLATDMLNKYKQLALPEAKTVDAREVLSGENFGFRQLTANSPLRNSRFRC
ncbi:MAG: uncharacterized protein JWO82_1872 [Akkermansiaceae bacterium]|nr:uncharacterized protein [Akkermansiaceae bacterium]